MQAYVFYSLRGLAALAGQNTRLNPPGNLIDAADQTLHLNGRLVALNDRSPIEFEEVSSVTDDSQWEGFIKRRFMNRQWTFWAKSTAYASYCIVVLP